MHRSGSLKGLGRHRREPQSVFLTKSRSGYTDIHSYPKGKLEVGGAITRTISVFSGFRSDEIGSIIAFLDPLAVGERHAVSFGRAAKPCDAYVRFPLPPGLQPFQVKSRNLDCRRSGRLAGRTKMSGLAASNGRT